MNRRSFLGAALAAPFGAGCLPATDRANKLLVTETPVCPTLGKYMSHKCWHGPIYCHEWPKGGGPRSYLVDESDFPITTTPDSLRYVDYPLEVFLEVRFERGACRYFAFNTSDATVKVINGMDPRRLFRHGFADERQEDDKSWWPRLPVLLADRFEFQDRFSRVAEINHDFRPLLIKPTTAVFRLTAVTTDPGESSS